MEHEDEGGRGGAVWNGPGQRSDRLGTARTCGLGEILAHLSVWICSPLSSLLRLVFDAASAAYFGFNHGCIYQQYQN
jgi:hypothetical protein